MGNRRGFSLLELVVVIVVGGIVATIAFNSFQNAQARMGPRAAQGQFLTMLAHARAIAVERGTPALLSLDAGAGTATIRARPAPGQPLEILDQRDLADSYGVQIALSDGDDVDVCMTPRGYADPSCGTLDAELTVRFTRNNQGTQVILLPSGQAIQP